LENLVNSRLFAKSVLLQLVLTVLAGFLSFYFWGLQCALAALAAGIVSSGDLLVMTLLAGKLSRGPARSRIFCSIALGIKFPFLISIVYLMVVVLSLNPLGLIVGFSTLVVAILYASLSFRKSLAEGDGA